MDRLFAVLLDLALDLKESRFDLLFGIGLHFFVFGFDLCRLFAVAVGFQPCGFELLNDLLKALMIAADILLCKRNDLGRKPQLFGNGKRIGFTRSADHQPIGGTQSGNIKFAGCVLHPGSIERIGLELGVVRGSGTHCPCRAYRFDYGNSKCRPLHGVGSRPKLVKETKRTSIDLVCYTHDIDHVR